VESVGAADMRGVAGQGRRKSHDGPAPARESAQSGQSLRIREQTGREEPFVRNGDYSLIWFGKRCAVREDLTGKYQQRTLSAQVDTLTLHKGSCSPHKILEQTCL
jgi:hypothetical protein